MQKRSWIYRFVFPSRPSPLLENAKPQVSGCVCLTAYVNRRGLQMAKINMSVLLKGMFTQTICSAPEIMNKWRFYWNNWKDFFPAYAIIEWHRRDFYQWFSMLHVFPVPLYELNASSCHYFTRVFVRNCRLLLQFQRVARFPKRSLAASKGYLDLAGQEGNAKGQWCAQLLRNTAFFMKYMFSIKRLKTPNLRIIFSRLQTVHICTFA